MPASDNFRTIAAPTQSLYKAKGSRFIGLAFPVKSEAEIKEILTRLRKTYFDARHHCYAYQLGIAGDQYRCNDDGEPNYTAGDSILGQIRSADLTNVLVVVVRYFGGIKLGVSGLITAYRLAAAEALNVATISEKTDMATLEILFNYAHLNAVMGIAKEFKLEVKNQDFNISCRLIGAVRKSLVEKVQIKFSNLATVKVV